MLTPGAPTSSIRLAPGRDLRAVTLTLRELVNPQRQSFAVTVTLTSGDRTESLGTISPFPIGQSGSFVLPITTAMSSAVRAAGGELQLRLVSVSGDRPLLEPLSVEVTAAS